MKRYFLLLVTIVVALTLFIFPAAASSDAIDGNIQGQYAYFSGVSAGQYELRVYTDQTRETLLLHVPSFTLTDGTLTTEYDGLSSVFDNVKLTVTYSEGRLECSLFGISVYDGSTIWIFGSAKYPNVVAEIIPIEEPLSFWDSIGVFFGSSIDMLADVATVVVSYPALLILTIGVVILGYIAFQIKRLM